MTAMDSPRSEPPAAWHELGQLDAYFRAANYLTAGQIYLMDNPLLRRPLLAEDIKPRLLGHWGTSPGLNFCYAHLSRCIKARELSVLFVCGPGHGGPAVVANTWLEGTYSELYPHVSRERRGHGPALSPVLLPRWHTQSLQPRGPRIDPRGRRARLFAEPCVRGRVRQPGPCRGLRGGRRRSRDRTSRHRMALEQVPRSPS